MNSRTKDPRATLNGGDYRELHRVVLERDRWTCQICGARIHLEVHHIRYRSHGGSDHKHNLITLCAECHAGVHRDRRSE